MSGGGLGSKAMVVAATSTDVPGGTTRLKDKKSFDYILRSGLAGGLAGCAVWLSLRSSGISMLIG